MTVWYLPCNKIENDWICGVCRGSEQTDVVAHEGSGEKHPIHKSCLLRWRRYSNLCPNCKVETITEQIFPRLEKFEQQLYRFCTRKNWQLLVTGLGSILSLTACVSKLPGVAGLGFALQSIGVHEALIDEAPRTEVVRQIDALCKEILSRYSAEKLTLLDRLARSSSKYRNLLLPWIEMEDCKMRLFGVKNLRDAVEKDLLINRVLRIYRNATGIAALLIAGKYCPRIFTQGMLSTILLHCIWEWSNQNHPVSETEEESRDS
ncbi:MAG: hypothetical protein K1X28_10200 [Parachlamydiales bacterium]|nr:hypothetical protein [Parachlamydiales bacterium]